jgi:hypothetical protein
MIEFEVVRPAALFLGAAKGYRGLATTFTMNGHRTTLIAPTASALRALCEQWAIAAPMADVAEPVVVLLRSITTEEDNDGLDGGVCDDGFDDDGLDDGL